MTEKPSLETPASGRRRRPWVKWLALGGGVFVVLIVAAVAILLAMLPRIVKSQIEKNGSEMLGQSVTVNDVQLSLFDGSATIAGIAVANPEGFDADRIFDFDGFSAEVSLPSLMADPLTIERLSLRGGTANLQVTKEGKQNLRELLRPMLEKAEEPPSEEERRKAERKSEKPARGIVLQELVLEDLTLNVDDAYAAEKEIQTSATLKSFAANNLILMPSAGTTSLPDATLAVEGLHLSAPSLFQEPQIVSIDSLSLSVKLARIFDTIEQPDIVIPEASASNVSFITERETAGDDPAQNLQYALTAIMNATTMGEPQKIPAPEATGSPGEAPGQKKKKRGIFGQIAGAAEAVGDSVQTAAVMAETVIQTELRGAGEKGEISEQETEELPFHRIAIDNLQITGFRFLRLTTADGERIEATATAEGSLLQFPQLDQTNSDLDVQIDGSQNGRSWSAHLVASGAIADMTLTGPTDARLGVEAFPLQEMGPITSGTVGGLADLTLKEGLLSGTLKVRFDNLAYKASNDALLQAVKKLDGLSLPEIKFDELPIRDMTPRELAAYLVGQLLRTALATFDNLEVPQELTEDLNFASEEVSEKIQQLQETTGKTTEQLEKAGSKAASTISGKLGGLFGSEEKDSE